jgi:2-C-methyl-D-erythritol 4-phosphate cytidylyltransferase
LIQAEEAMLVERMGHKIKLVPGSPLNIKITTPDDLKMAEAILLGRLGEKTG